MSNEKRARKKELHRQKVEAARRAEKRNRSLRLAGTAAVLAVTLLIIAIWINATQHSSLISTTTTSTMPSVTSTTSSSTTTSGLITQSVADQRAVAAGCPASTSARVNTLSWSSAPSMQIDTSKSYYADVTTTAGNFTIALNAAAAPKTVNNFVFLARHNYFHCIIFHRVIPGFMAQTGDPTGTGSGGPGYSFADELPTGAYPLFGVAMANSGPNTNGSQFFIVTGSVGEGLPDSYSLFGKVTSGTSTIMAINDEGNSDPNSNGVPPVVTHRILTITIRN